MVIAMITILLVVRDLTHMMKEIKKMTENELRLKVKSLRFDLMVSIRYNSKRERFFKRWDNFSNILSLLFGSSVIVTLFKQYELVSLIFAFLITIISACSLVINFNEKVFIHKENVKEFTDLINKLVFPIESKTILIEVEKEINLLNAKEGEPLSTLYDICYNEQLEAEGANQKPINICCLRKVFAQYI